MSLPVGVDRFASSCWLGGPWLEDCMHHQGRRLTAPNHHFFYGANMKENHHFRGFMCFRKHQTMKVFHIDERIPPHESLYVNLPLQ